MNESGYYDGPKTAVLGPSVENPTVEANIDRKIARHQKEIDRLLQSKEELKPLLHMRIGDLRNAMDY